MAKKCAAQSEPTRLTPLELQALKILGKAADKCRDELREGTGQEVDFTVRVTGAITVPPDNVFDGAVKPTAEDMLAIVLANVGTRTFNTIYRVLIDAYGNLALDEERHRPVVSPQMLEVAAGVIQNCTIQRTKRQRGGVVGSLKLERA